jgi:hypothetical protein
MARHGRRAGDDLRLWQGFARRHKSHPHLRVNPLYALPAKLVDLVKKELPSFGAAGEEEFERDPARTTAAGGFFHRRPFACPLSPPPDPGWELEQKQLDAFITETMRADGRSDLQIENYFKAEAKRKGDLRLRAVTYTAWLVANPLFGRERDEIRRTWEGRVAASARFPTHRRSYLRERPDPVDRDEPKLLRFYRRWGLDTFATWELPVPMPPQMFGITHADHATLPGAGLLTFVPWYALRDERLTLKDLAKQLAAMAPPTHLKEWLSRDGGRGKKVGYQRLHHSYVVYRYWDLALASRYRERLEGSTERLGQAFATYLELSTDSIKKIRNRLGRALRSV